MKLVGFSKKKIDDKHVINAVLDVIIPNFGSKDFYFTNSANDNLESLVEFDLNKCAMTLKSKHCLGFWKKNSINVWIDNQAHNDPFYSHPHSFVELEPLGAFAHSIEPEIWLNMAKKLIGAMEMDLTIVIGNNENLHDYWRTPLGFKIGLIKVHWIMCFGQSYSRLIDSKRQETNFFRREEFCNGTEKAFVSARSFDLYAALSHKLSALQRTEIGDDLFHHLPLEDRMGGAEANWIFNPKIILRFLKSFHRQSSNNWQEYQARVVP